MWGGPSLPFLLPLFMFLGDGLSQVFSVGEAGGQSQ